MDTQDHWEGHRSIERSACDFIFLWRWILALDFAKRSYRR